MRKIVYFIITVVVCITTISSKIVAQVTGKYGTYYDQRELLFESMPTSTSDIIFLGNSITDGGEWSELFQNPHCKNRGISGDIIPGVLNRLETITKGQPAMIFLMIGTNDMNWGFSNDTIALGVRTIVQRIKEESPNTRIVVQSILPTNDCYGLFSGHTKRWADVAVINGMLRDMAIEEGVDYLDLFRAFATDEGKLNPALSNDGLHLNSEGYLLWKSIIEENYGSFPRPVFKNGAVPIWLNASTGTSIIQSVDLGASPLRYFGVGLNVNPGITLEWDDYRLQYDGRLFANLCFNNVFAETFEFDIDSRLEFLYHCYDTYHNRLHFWAGGTIQAYFNIKYYPQLMNAALGYSLFGNLHATGMAAYDFAPLYDGEHNLFTAYAKLSLPLVGLVNRPGFAYIENATGSVINVNDLQSQREDFAMLFPGVSTDIGLVLNLPNTNKIGISYRWDYLTTRNNTTYRFDHAIHAFNLNYMFNLY